MDFKAAAAWLSPWLALLCVAAAVGAGEPRAIDDTPAPQGLVTRVYDVRDLFVNAPDELEEDGEAAEVDDEEDDGITLRDIIENVIGLITDTIDPPSWKADGDGRAAVRARWRQFIVTQTPANHRKLDDLLGQVRETRGERPLPSQWPAWPAVTEDLLARPAPDRELKAVPFADALAELRGRFDLPLDVDYEAVEAAGVNLASPVTASRRDATVADALALALRHPRAGRTRLVYFVQGNGRIIVRPMEE